MVKPTIYTGGIGSVSRCSGEKRSVGDDSEISSLHIGGASSRGHGRKEKVMAKSEPLENKSDGKDGEQRPQRVNWNKKNVIQNGFAGEHEGEPGNRLS